MTSLANSAHSLLVAAGDVGLPGSYRLLQSLTYLLDRRQGRQSFFTSQFHGPVSPEIYEALDRWLQIGLGRLTITRDGSRPDPLEGDIIRLTALTGPRGFELPTLVAEDEAARELLDLARRSGALKGATAPTVAAKLAWMRELDPSSTSTPLEELVTTLHWAQVTDQELSAGVALARALGY